jgi:polysaccharide export outer membrane protein
LGHPIILMRFLVLVTMLPLAAACGSLPASGPPASSIKAAAQQAAPPFDVVALDVATADFLAAWQPPSLSAAFGEGGGAPDLRIGVGDVVVVTIFEAASGGLFSGEAGTLGTASKSVSLPPQPVARSGAISVPYVGEVAASGRTPVEVQGAIAAALRDKAIEPQVIVTVTKGASAFVTLTGDVGQPGLVELNLSGDRLLDLVASAGGSRAPAYDSFVRLTRDGRSVTVPLSKIVSEPRQNIYLRPDDLLYVFTDPQVYTAFGAVARNATYPFQTDRLTLAEAVSRAGGPIDSRANARGVFLFRYERPELYARLKGVRPASQVPPALQQGGVPVVYSLDLKDPSSFFAAQRFLVRDNDLLYISNAPSTDLTKFLAIIGTALGTVSSTAGLVDTAQDISDNN